MSKNRIKKAGRALPASSNSPAEQTEERDPKAAHYRKLVGMTVDSAPTMRINTQGFGRVATAGEVSIGLSRN